MKTFLIDLDKCRGCYACQVGCKDEHCDNCWMPYAQTQPETGQFWMKVKEQERGGGSHVHVTFTPTPCQHCADCTLIRVAPDAVYKREDGLVIIDPEKAKGRKELVKACPYGVVYWNEELELPQKCTGCAHLIDEGDTITVPRCYDNCVHDAITWAEESEMDLTGAQRLHPEYGTAPRVWYKGLPEKFIAATVYDPEAMEVVEGAVVVAKNGKDTFTAVTDEFGDFWMDGLPASDWQLSITGNGKVKTLEVSTTEKDQGLPDIALA